MIEYQGVQHFEPIAFFGGKESFSTRTANDRIKKEYCNANKIRLFYINYNDNIQEKLDKLIQSEEMVWPRGNT